MFFTQMYQMMNQAVDITLVIRKKEGQLMVSAMPKSNGLKDEAQNQIVPMTLTGNPQELDMGFMQTICQPMQKATGLLINMKVFEEQTDKAAENSKAAKEQKDKAAKEAKEKKEKFDKLMKKAAELETEQKFNDALNTLKQAKSCTTQNAMKGVDEKINALRMKMSQGSLFGTEEVQQPYPPQQAVQPIIQPQTVQPAEQPVQQPVNQTPNGYPQTNVQTFNGNGYVNANGQQPVYQTQQLNGQLSGGHPQTTQQNINYQNHNTQPMTEVFPEPEPDLAMVADYSAHREGEYDQYPDYPGYTDNNMFNS